MFYIIPDTLLISYVILQYPVIWNSFKIWQQIWRIYPLMRPILYENKGGENLDFNVTGIEWDLYILKK